MGTINENLCSNDISFQNITKMFNYILSQEKTKAQNMNVLKEIGIIKEYSYLLYEKNSKDIKYVSKNHKTLKNYIKQKKAKSYFIKWICLIFDIQEQYYKGFPDYEQKIQQLINILLTKSFFIKNVKKNFIENESNIKIMKYGIPKYLREFIWEIIIAEKYSSQKYFNRSEEEKEYNIFKNDLNKNIDFKQIEKDITRTFPEISDINDNRLHKLKNLLIYASSLMKDGYCQGMNFVIGFFLKLSNFDEIKSYYYTKNIFPKIKGYFEQGFPLLKKNINLFYKFFSKLFPKLDSHFTKNDVFAQFWVSKWFQTLFTLSLPFDELCCIWDFFFFLGFDFAIFISLAIIHYLEKYLMKLNDSSDILSYFKNALNPEIIDSKNLKDLENKDKYIIPLSKIFLKALDIEQKITKDKKFQEIIINSKNEDCDSIYSKNTKETDTTITNPMMINNSFDISSKSCLSGNNTFTNSLESNKKIILKDIKFKPKHINNNNNNLNINFTKYNDNINNNLQNYISYYNNMNNFYAQIEYKKVYHLFESIDLTNGRFNDLNINKYVSTNYTNIYNTNNINIPSLNHNYIYPSNRLYININPESHYHNFFVRSIV